VRLLPAGPAPGRRQRFDVVGAALSAVGLGLVVYALVRSSAWGWVVPREAPFTVLGFSPTVPALLLGAAVLRAFWRWESSLDRSTTAPLLDPALLRIPTLRAGLSVLGVQQFVLAGTFFALPLYLQMVLGLDAFQSGRRILPLSVAVLVVSFAGGRLASRYAPRAVVAAGLGTTTAGVVLLMAAVDVQLRALVLAGAMLVLGIGIGLVVSQLGNVIQSSVTDDRRSEAGGLQGTAQNLGASVGTALIGAVLLGGLASGFSSEVAADPRVSPQLLAAVEERAQRGLDFVTLDTADGAARAADLSASDADVVVDAYADAQLRALKSALGAVAIAGLCGLVVVRRLPARALVSREAEPAERPRATV
jgi:Na+/melibiose symporter-like transporter